MERYRNLADWMFCRDSIFYCEVSPIATDSESNLLEYCLRGGCWRRCSLLIWVIYVQVNFLVFWVCVCVCVCVWSTYVGGHEMPFFLSPYLWTHKILSYDTCPFLVNLLSFSYLLNQLNLTSFHQSTPSSYFVLSTYPHISRRRLFQKANVPTRMTVASLFEAFPIIIRSLSSIRWTSERSIISDLQFSRTCIDFLAISTSLLLSNTLHDLTPISHRKTSKTASIFHFGPPHQENPKDILSLIRSYPALLR